MIPYCLISALQTVQREEEFSLQMQSLSLITHPSQAEIEGPEVYQGLQLSAINQT